MKAKRVRPGKKKVYWFMGMPGLVRWYEADMLAMVARWTKPQYIQYRCPPLSVVRLRPLMIERFMQDTKNPLDTLVMLDIDHEHPKDVVNSLVASDEFGIYTSLTFKRAPTLPVAWAMDYKDGWDKPAHHVSQITAGEILECDRGGAGAMAIQRRVIKAILKNGHTFKQLFQYVAQRDCDEYFAKLCSEAGFRQYVDTAVVSPHVNDTLTSIGIQEWDEWAKGKGEGGWIDDE
jgi:hypothetical protein